MHISEKVPGKLHHDREFGWQFCSLLEASWNYEFHVGGVHGKPQEK